LRFHVVGGHAGDIPFYEATKAQMQRRANLTFHGPVPYGSVNEFYARARVLVNVSDVEGFPNSYLQAWIRGTPVAAYFDPDSMIARNELGVAADSYEALREAVALFASNEPAWQAASARCRAFMAARFREESVLRPYVQAVDRSIRQVSA
jgi:glycosyltransferase involved in cell wall biosynthesis